MSEETTSPPSLKSVQRQLAKLRAQIRRWFLVDGFAKVALTILLMVFLDFWIDRIFRMDRAQRLVMLLIMAGVVAYMVWRYILRPLGSKVTDDALLLEVEKNNPDLRERLINAFQLARINPEESAASPALLEDAIRKGVREADHVKFDSILHAKKSRRNLWMFVGSLLGLFLLTCSLFVAKPMQTWFKRNVLLSSQAQWPQDYYLKVVGAEDGTLLVPRGEDWPVIVNVERVMSIPESLQLEYDGNVGVRREVMNRLDKLQFESTLRDVQEELRFRIVGRKANSPWINVELVERPEVIATSLEADPPTYTGMESAELPPGTGPYYVLDGTKISVQGEASKDLRGAELVFEGTRIPLTLNSDRSFSGEIPPEDLAAGVYTVSLLGTEEVIRPGEAEPTPLRSSDSAQFTIRIKEDNVPKLKAKARGIGNLVVANARIPYRVQATDDFAVQKLDVDVDWTLASDDGTSTNGNTQIAVEGIENQLGGTEVESLSAFELETALPPIGARVAMKFVAEDNNNINGPGTGVSQVVYLRVVKSNELREDILRRNKEIRQRMEVLRKKQDGIGTDILALKADTGSIKKMTDRQRLDLNKAQKEQKLLGTQMKTLQTRLGLIKDELINNRLEEETSALIGRMERDILDPMESLSGNEIPAAAENLDGLRRIEAGTSRSTAFDEAYATNREILGKMDDILKFMEKNEDFQLAVNLLHEIRKAQEGVRQRTEDERKRRIKELIEQQRKKDRE